MDWLRTPDHRGKDKVTRERHQASESPAGRPGAVLHTPICLILVKMTLLGMGLRGGGEHTPPKNVFVFSLLPVCLDILVTFYFKFTVTWKIHFIPLLG